MAVREGYKQTEIGVIPEDWEVVELDAAVEFLDGQRRPVKSSDRIKMHGVYPYYGASGVIDYVNEYIFNEELILLGEDGENILSRNLPLAFRVNGKIWVNNHAHVMRVNREYHIGYLTDFLESLDYTLLNSGTAQPKLNKQTCLKIKVARPTKAEQTAIANALSDVDALIQSLDALISKKRLIKQGAMQTLLNPYDEQGQLKDGWVVKRFEAVLSRVNIKDHQIQTSDYQTSGHYPVIDQGKDIIVGYSDREDKVFQCPEGGIIVFGDHTCIIKYINFNFLIGADGTQVLRAINGEYTCFYAFQLQHKGIHSTGYNRHFKFLKKREFIVPYFQEQTQIATILSDMDAEITALETKRSKVQAIKQGMMQNLLTGKIRLLDAQELAHARA